MGADVRAEAKGETAFDAARRLLLENPEFLRQDADLLGALGLRLDAANVVDFGPAALARVHAAHAREATAREQVEATARENYIAQAQANAAVVELLGSAEPPDLALRLDEVARVRFGLVGSVLALECDEDAPAGWRRLVEGQVDMIMGGPSRPARLGHAPTALGLFGDRAAAVQSLALIRLCVAGRHGVMAFAAAEPDGFDPTMGLELVQFLGQVVERTAERWITR